MAEAGDLPRGGGAQRLEGSHHPGDDIAPYAPVICRCEAASIIWRDSRALDVAWETTLPETARRLAPAALFIAAALPALACHAQARAPSAADIASYPNRPIHLIVPFPPGGGNDNVARPIAAKAAVIIGQPIIIENKPGAGTTIGADYVAKSAPDGYTVLLGSIGSNVLAPYLYKKLPYDPAKDLQAVSLLATAPNILVVGKDSRYRTLAELVAAAKAAPGKLTYASPGIGTPAHLAAEIFKKQAGVDILHVPYKGGANYLPDVIAGRVDLVFDTTTSSIPLLKAGQTRALAISRPTRLPDFPDVPTFKEAGFPNYDTGSWYALFAPAHTPQPIVQKLSDAFGQAVRDPDVSKLLTGLGAFPVGGSPTALQDFVSNESKKYGAVIKDNNITAE
jgi:tripartite-type tricarboxylate transporter receptor subunit TctC